MVGNAAQRGLRGTVGPARAAIPPLCGVVALGAPAYYGGSHGRVYWRQERHAVRSRAANDNGNVRHDVANYERHADRQLESGQRPEDPWVVSWRKRYFRTRWVESVTIAIIECERDNYGDCRTRLSEEA